MIKRSPTRQTVAWFIDLIIRGQMNLDPPYQRRSVWSKQFKSFFIDTIIRNYPSPPIFLNLIVTQDGIVKYDVVDGKQRLEAIMDFVNDIIALPVKFGNKDLDGKYFSELSGEYKKTFYEYAIPVEQLSIEQEDIINQAFDRLNRNVLKLTAQELRHSMFSGRFITFVSEIAEDSFWADICISRTAMVRRMKDVEFISELFLLTIHKIESTNKDMLDKYYALYDEEIPDEIKHRRTFENIKRTVEQLNLNICKNRLKYYSDFYTLWSALLGVKGKKINFSKTRANILAFFKKLDPESADKDIVNYLNAIRSQPNEARNRKIRKKIFMKLIKIK